MAGKERQEGNEVLRETKSADALFVVLMSALGVALFLFLGLLVAALW